MYQRGYLFFVVSQVFFSASTIAAPIQSIDDWKGFYAGVNTGAIFSRFNTPTTTQAGSMFTLDEAKIVNSVGNQVIDTTGFLSGIEGGYNWQFDKFLLGFEANIQSLSSNGMKYSAAIPYLNSGAQYVITTYAANNWLLTAKPRLGLIANHWLLYTTGGLGLTYLQSDFLFTNSLGLFESQRVNQAKLGYVVGAGVERSVTPHVSLKTEYLFANFDTTNASVMKQGLPAGQTFLNSVQLKSNIVNLGLHYHMDDPLPNPLLTSLSFDASQWKAKVGARLFVSSGLTGAPQPLFNSSNIGDVLASRLTFSKLSATSEELFTRIDHSSGVFAKGYLAAGSVSGGQLNDEDFPAGGEVYSNTLSNASGNLSYATVDLGYAFLKSETGNVGAFVGYNYYAQNLNIYNCTQLAGSSTCVPATDIAHFLALSEDDSFNSLRIGLSSELNLTKRWILTSDAAYLPMIHFRGLDMHNARQLVGPETSNQGDGVMLESVLNYQLNDSWGIGLGGRYWVWNMHQGSLLFDFLGQDELIEEPARFNAQRYGAFLQVNYHLQQLHDIAFESTLSDWRGLFVGGNLGGIVGHSYWSDPFGANISATGYVNAAHFGDQIRSSGPLAGIDLHMNWQRGRLIYGIGGSLAGADSRGENTVFSGIGGVNGQEKSNVLGTIVGRIGTTVDHTLFYLNAGGAMLHTQYNIIANTGILTLGIGSQTLNTWGWTGGVGVEHALTRSWSTSVEYDYIGIPDHTLAFSAVELINQQKMIAHGNMSVFKLGVNYKFMHTG